MPPDLKSYLAEKYMSGPKADAILAASQTKKKRKTTTTFSQTAVTSRSARIVDEDEGWPQDSKEDEDDIKEAVVASDRGFKKRRVGKGDATWVTVQEGTAGVGPTSEGGIEEDERLPLDEQPMVVDTPFAGGLVTAKELKRVLPQHTVPGKGEYTAEEIAQAQETVYRDTSGKKIDTKLAKAEAARLKREREEKEMQKMEWGKGLVQRDDQEKRRKEMAKNRSKTFARGIDDKDLNDDLKSKELWNDPAAAFLSKNKSKGPKKPEYTGPPPPPNRYGIKPGYRWDGVDRGNGFETKFFQSVNARKRRDAQSYSWGVDDM